MKRRVLFFGALYCIVGASVTDDSLSAQVQFELVGLHAGAMITAGENTETLLGVHAGFRLGGPLSLVTVLDLRSDFPDDPTGAWSGTALSGKFTVRVRAPGPIGFMSVGIGLAAAHSSASNEIRSLKLSETDLREVLVVSASAPIWRLRPFADLHLVNAIRSPTEPTSHLTAGISVTVR